MTPAVYRAIWAEIANLVAYRPKPDICDWAEREIVLQGPNEARPGPLSLDLTPYARGILRAAADDATTDLTLVAATQVIKTTILRLVLAYEIANTASGSALWVWPNEKSAKNFSKGRWQPMVTASSALFQLRPRDTDEFTNLRQNFGGRWVLRLEGSGSPANLASEPASLVIIDEVDKLAEETEREAGAVLLADERTKSYPRAKRIKAGTPTLETGPIWQSFLKGSMEYFFVPCPHCGLFFTPKQAHLVFDHCKIEGGYDLQKLKREVFLRCPSDACQQPIRESHKQKMLLCGEWRATNPNPQPGHRSFQLPSFVSPFVSAGTMAIQWVLSHKTPGGLQNYVNSWLGEPWNFSVDSDPGELARAIKPGHVRGTVWGDFVVLTVDVQRTELHWLARGYGAGESRLINHGTVGTIEEIDDLQQKLGAKFVGIDSGFRTTEVYQWVYARRAKGWSALKGWQRGKNITWTQRINPFFGDARRAASGATIKLLHINNQAFDTDIFAARRGEMEGWFVYEKVGNDRIYVSELFAVYPRLEKDSYGFQHLVSYSKGDEHRFDLERYNRAVAYDARLVGPRSRFHSTILNPAPAAASPPSEATAPEAPMPENKPAAMRPIQPMRLEKIEPSDPEYIGKKPPAPPVRAPAEIKRGGFDIGL